jgi:hypothetical protein
MRKQWLIMTLIFCALGGYAFAGDMGTYAFPQKGQTPEQQKTDETSCAQWATDQTGLNPAVLQYQQQEAQAAQQKASVEANNPRTGRRVGRAAVTGAALGSMNKSMDDGAGKGAAMGATLAVAKRRGEKVEDQAQAPLKEANAKSQKVQGDTQEYVKAYCACMEGKGYSIR